ncbi:hypothetical protein TI05_08930 [Achromatium sp. WMS3]|nr:hypothetical protein TI05_08930 [Achromatium sp. WMS3]
MKVKIIITQIAITSLIFMLLIINGGIWWLWNLDLNNYKTPIANIVAKYTGWQLSFNGNLEHHITADGFQLIIKDLLVTDLNRQFVDIEYLRTSVNLKKLFDYQISLNDMQIAVRNSDIELRPVVSPPLPIPLTMNADAVHLTVKDCHVHDAESEMETQIKDLTLDISTVPIAKNGWLMLGMPIGTLWSQQQGTAKIASITFGQVLGMQNITVDFINNYGKILILKLISTLKLPNKTNTGIISPQVIAKGKIHINFDETPDELVRTLWKGVDDIRIAPLTLKAKEANIVTTNGSIGLQKLHIDSDGLPLLVRGASLWTWLAGTAKPQKAAPIQRTTITGKAGFYDTINIANYSIDLKLQPGIFNLLIRQGVVGILFPQNSSIGAAAFNLQGNMYLTLSNLQPTQTWPQSILLEQLALKTTDITLVTPDGDYNLVSSNLDVQDLPLIKDGEPITLELPQLLLKIIPAQPLFKFSILKLSHKNAVIDSINLVLKIQNDSLLMQQLEASIAGSKLTGIGDLRFTETQAPWYLKINSPNLSLNPLLTMFGKPDFIQGALSVDLALASHGFEISQALDNLNGNIKIKGYDLQMQSIDVDAILTHLEDSRGIGFLDLGAYMLLGPAGILLTKGTQYSVLLGSLIEQGQSRMPIMHTELKIKSGVVKAQDVALTTANHRLAVSGTLDLRDQGPAALQIATVDSKGCAKYMETIGGTGRDPQVSQTGVVINSVLNPVKSVVGTIIGPVIGACFTPFYQGQVPAPQ